ncbi:MAG: DEAD/DEAH box helicase family protein [Bacteroidaceae bacterium]|nr:DEAD/DEAH box helicase family protein [Bacteroidaceae bacterium]
MFFQISFDEQKHAYVSIVNDKNTEVNPDYRLYNGETFHVLRSIDTIRKEQQNYFSWDETDKRIYLKEYPYLLYQLLRCNNLISAKSEPISVSAETAIPQLFIDKKDGQISTSFSLKVENKEIPEFKFLTDIFVLADHVIYPIQSVGENYDKLDFFKSSFPEHLFEKFLSVFYSYMENIVPIYENYTLVYSPNEVETIPTIVFEKVDTDMALYLRVTQMLPNADLDFFQNFDLLYIATLTIEHQIILKRISQQSNESATASLHKQIMQCAPSKAAAKEIYRDNDFFIIPQTIAGPFLLQALPSLVKEFQLLGAENLKDYKVKPVVPKLNINIGSGIDFLEGEANLTLEGENFSLKQFLQQYKKQKYILLSDGNRAIVDNGYVKRLERIFKQERGNKNIKISFFDLPEVESMLEERMKGEVFERHHKVFEGFNELSKQRMRFTQVNAQLRNYQQEGVKWINYLYENNLGGCLADDMGLGKTLQTIAMLARIYPQTKEPTLIVMPKSLIFNWQNELQRFAPQLTVYTYYGLQRDMQKALTHQLVLSTYAIVRNDAESFCKQKFHYVILDESQNIKNVSSQTTQAIHLLQAKHRLALSGTPIENNLTELYSLFRFLNPAMFGSLEDFNARYTYPIQKDNDKDVLQGLRRKIFPFLLRRLKKDVLKELPDRIDQTLYVEMEKEHADFYNERRNFYQRYVKNTIASEGIQKSQFVMFQALNELRRIASVPESMTDGQIASPKISTLVEMITDAVWNGHKVVIFFNYIAGIELVSEKLNEAGIDFACMTGSTNDRKGVVERFQNNPHCKVLLMTLKTGGVGLNLTAADTVFIFEPWWNKAAEEQAINRLHRFGQKAKVLCYSLITQNSIEEKICLLQQQKAELFAGLIGNDASSTKLLTEEDIQFILS